MFIVENEINFLAFPRVEDSLLIFGSGYGVGRLKALKWLHECELYYWGDIDVHGLAILDSVRGNFPPDPVLSHGPGDLAASPRAVGDGP